MGSITSELGSITRAEWEQAYKNGKLEQNNLSENNQNNVLYHYTNRKALEAIVASNKYKYTDYVAIDISGLNITKGREGVYVVINELPLDLTGKIVGVGEVEIK